jgi:hypothetical protein
MDANVEGSDVEWKKMLWAAIGKRYTYETRTTPIPILLLMEIRKSLHALTNASSKTILEHGCVSVRVAGRQADMSTKAEERSS